MAYSNIYICIIIIIIVFNNFNNKFILIMNIDNPIITQLTSIEDNGSGLTVIPMTNEELAELCCEKPHYSDDENIQKKFEFAVKKTGIGRVVSAMCKEFNNETLKQFIEEYFENNKLWTDYIEQDL